MTVDLSFELLLYARDSANWLVNSIYYILDDIHNNTVS